MPIPPLTTCENFNVLNNRLLRIVLKKSIKTHNNDLYESYFTLHLQLLHQFNILLFMHNYVYHRNKLPVVFSTYFEENKVIRKYNTRQKNDFHIDSIKSEIGKRSIKYKDSKLWNDLPAELKEIQSFKYKL